ncbi:MAG: outer membrane protein assembly factor BamD [Flavobacteriaceae bacterium]|nr:outer membrane protein assembly factor BamD [Flavobacteriaceae bacterium]
MIRKISFIFFISLLLSGCSEYSKVLNKGKNAERYDLAEKLYEQGEYKKCIPLYEKLVGPYGGKPQLERIQFMLADSYYQTGNYELSSYYFEKFIANYPGSSKIEEAAYLSAHSYYLAAPKYSRDQMDTKKAMEAFEGFIATYPESSRIPQANKIYLDLTGRLEKKDFEIAKQYYHTEHYTAAMKSFDIFNEEHLGSIYREEAMYYKFKASYETCNAECLNQEERKIGRIKTSLSEVSEKLPGIRKTK